MRNVAIGIENRHFRIGHDGAGGIEDRSGNSASADLGKRVTCAEKAESDESKKVDSTPVFAKHSNLLLEDLFRNTLSQQSKLECIPNWSSERAPLKNRGTKPISHF